MTTVTDAATAVADIEDGSVIAVGGSVNAGAPMALVRALAALDVGDLTVVGGMMGTLAIDFLIALGKVRKVICPYVGNPEVAAVGPAYRFAAREGRLDICETEEGVHLAGLRAAAAKLPFGVWRASVGTSIPDLNPDVDLVTHRGIPYLRVKPIEIDVSLFWAPAASVNGDVGWWRVSLGDRELAHASRRRVVQVDRLTCSGAELREFRLVTVGLSDVVVPDERGPWPFAGPANGIDLAVLARYAACRSLGECREVLRDELGVGR